MPDATATYATVTLAAAGDRAAFASLVAEHHPSMMRVAYVITADAETARDAVQSAWAIAWRRLRDVKEPSKVHAWLVAVAANEARQTVRRRGRVTVIDLSDVLEHEGSRDPADGIDAVDLAHALRRLRPEDRVLLTLRFVGGLDSGEIAAQLGGSASGVRTKLSRLIERLRVDLDFHDGPDA